MTPTNAEIIREWQELNKDFLQVRRLWYNNEAILFEIVRQHAEKETAFLNKINKVRFSCNRNLKCNSISYLYKNFEAFDFLKEPSNLYYSLAHFRNHPIFSFSPHKKRQQQFEWGAELTNKPDKHICGYDLFIDLDDPKLKGQEINEERLKPVYECAKRLKMLFDAHRLPYQIAFSGSKGFHFEIPFKYFHDYYRGLPVIVIINKLRNIIFNLKKNFEFIDTQVIDLRRICKTKYSLDVESGYVCYPLTQEEFNYFSLDVVNLTKILSRVKRNPSYLKNRRKHLIKNSDKNISWLRDNTRGFFDEYSKD